MTDETNSENASDVRLVSKDDDGGFKEEIVRARKMGDDFQLDGIPFFASNLAYGDIFSVEDDDGALYFEALVQPSGHSTLQIVFFKPDLRVAVMKTIEALGCSHGGLGVPRYLAVDVPARIDYSTIKTALANYEGSGVLDYREACLSDVHRKQSA